LLIGWENMAIIDGGMVDNSQNVVRTKVLRSAFKDQSEYFIWKMQAFGIITLNKRGRHSNMTEVHG